MILKPWTIISSHVDKSYGLFNLRRDRGRSPRTNEIYDFYVLESPAWVNIIPLTPTKDIVLIRQYRFGIRDMTLEIPGGLMEPSDSPEETARRELREETGYREKTLIPLGTVHPNPAIQNNLCYTFLAKDVLPAGQLIQDEREDIEVVIQPLSEIPSLIRDGRISHSLVIAAFYRFYMEYELDMKC